MYQISNIYKLLGPVDQMGNFFYHPASIIILDFCNFNFYHLLTTMVDNRLIYSGHEYIIRIFMESIIR